MIRQKSLLKVVFLIGVITVISGFVQMIKPDFVLSIIGGQQTPGGNHSFAIVGMFMVLFGAMLIHALATPSQQPMVVLWCSIQKLGAAAAVSIGVAKGYFSTLALLVAGFDLFSFLLMMAFWFCLQKNNLR